MNTTYTRNVSFLSGIAAMCFVSTPICACNCIKPKTAKAGLRISDAVFVGKVVDIKHQKFYTRTRAYLGGGKSKMVTTSQEFYKLQFAISHSWKGTRNRTVFILADFGSSCSREYYKGKTYLVYAYTNRKPRYKGDKDLYTHMCTRTEGVLKAKKDLTELGKGKVPQL